jgi:DNA-binding transcriptional LysR family regulator
MDKANRLDLFLEVIQQGSFAKAADTRNLDRSALSKQIKVLENELGVRLLNRSTRALSVTDAGVEIAKQAEKLREALAKTQRIAESFHESPKGLLRITSPTLFGTMYIQKAVNIFMARYPDIHVKVVLEDRRSDIIGERFDIAFRIGPPRDSNLIAKKLADSKISILASKAFIEKYGNPETPEDLMKLPAVIYSNGEYTLDKVIISDAPGSSNFKTHTMHGRYEVNEIRALMDAVQSGLGYSIRGLFTLDRNIKELGLVPLLTNYRLSTDSWGIFAIYPHRNQTPIVKGFIEVVQELIGTPPVWDDYIDNYKNLYK